MRSLLAWRDAQEAKTNADQQRTQDAEWLVSPSIGQGSGKKDAANESRKGDCTDAAELFICQACSPAKIHSNGSQEDWHEIYCGSETHHARIAESQRICLIE